MFKRRQSTPASIKMGSLLHSRYRLLHQLGEGGAGVIYKATDEQLGRLVAIKVLTGGGGMTADKQARFRSEARSVARLNHPNIVTLYDYADDQDQPFLVMEFIPGQDLWALDNDYSPNLMPFEVSLPIIDGILAALEYSHQHDVIHRDLKPENVMITPEMQVKVMDFGLARIQGQSRLTQEGLVAGTASYLAPELALGEPGDHRVDLYALGVILYELCTGRRPFAGDDPLAIISQHIHAPVVPPQRYNANIPSDLQVIIQKLLAKQPEERFANATEVRQLLGPIQLRLENNLNDDRPTDTYPINEALSLETTAPHQVLLDRLARGVMVGREAELNELKRRWDLARLGQPLGEPLVLISGEAGIGKTRLLQEFKVYANLRDGYVLHGAARQQDAGTPYAIFANALRDYVREQPADLLRRHTPGFIAGEVVKLAPQLADKIGYIPPNPTLEPEAERARLLEQVSDFFLYMAGEHPILLLLDDLHFADPGSLDLLETLIRRSTGGSLLVTGAYQDVALTYSNPINHLTAALNSANLAHTIPLRRLARPGVEQMLLALLGNSVSEEFVDSIYRATEGNPLFVEEVVKGLAVDGQIRLKDGLWQRRDSGRLNLPGSLKSVLGGRLERIEKSTLELLQLAAVIGRSFSPELLVRAGSYDDEASTQAAIEEALGYQLIEIRNISDQPADSADKRGLNLEYQFQHGLIAEALYEELRPLRRRRLHRNVAKAMASLQTQPTPAVLAYHFIAAAQEDQAVPYLRQAGQAASQVYANTEAVDHLSQAREILEDLALDLRGKALQQNLVERFELLSEERAVLNLMSQPNRELAALQELQRLVDALQDKSREVAVMSRLAAYYWQVGKLNQAEETARQALQMAHNNKDRQGELYGLEQLARIFWTRRDGESMHFASKALEIAQELADRHREGRLTELIGSIYTDTLHDVKQAAYYFAQALAICRETNNRYEEAWTLWGMGGLALLIDDYTDALERYAEAKQISEAIGSTLQVGWDLYYMGDVWYSLGDYEQALSAYQQAQTIFSSAHHQRGGIYSLISLGLVALAQDALEKAEGYLEQAKQQAEDRNDLILMLRSYEGWVAFYQTLQEEDAYVAAIRLSNRIIKLAHEGGHFEHELLGYYLRGLGFYALADFDQAYDSSATAVTYLDHLTYLHSPQVTVAEIYFQHYRILTALKQTSEAQSFLQKAYSETMRKANLIIDDQQYDDYLNQVGLNRAIVAAATR